MENRVFYDAEYAIPERLTANEELAIQRKDWVELDADGVIGDRYRFLEQKRSVGRR